MLALDFDDLDHGIVLSAVEALDNDQYYAMVDSGTMQSLCRCILECKERLQSVKSQVPQVTGPIVQVYEHDGARRLVVALPNSAILLTSVTRMVDDDCRMGILTNTILQPGLRT